MNDPNSGHWFGLPLPGPATGSPLVVDGDLTPIPAVATPEPLNGTRLHGHVQAICEFSEQSRRDGVRMWGRHAGTAAATATLDYMEQELLLAGAEVLGRHEQTFHRSNFPLYWDVSLEAPRGAADWRPVVLRSAVPIEVADGTDRTGGNLANASTRAVPDSHRVLEGELEHVGDGSALSLADRNLSGKIAVFAYESNPSWFYMDLDETLHRIAQSGAAGVIAIHRMPGNLQQIAGRLAADVPGFHLGGEDGAFLQAAMLKARRTGAGELRARLEIEREGSRDLQAGSLMARVKGRTAHKNVILSAHTDAFFSGANDNASGLAVLLGLAGALAGGPTTECDTYFYVSPGHHDPTGGMRGIVDHYPQVAREAVIAVNLEHVAQGGAYRSYLRRTADAYGNTRCDWVPTTWDSPGREVTYWPASPSIIDAWNASAHRTAFTAPTTAGSPAIAEPMSLQETRTPAIQCVETGPWFHSSADTPDTVGPQNLQRAGAFFLDFVTEISTLQRSTIWKDAITSGANANATAPPTHTARRTMENPTATADPAADLAAGKGFVEKTVSADGFTTRYWEAGTGNPVLYIHPAGGPQHNLGMDRLAQHFRVIQLQLPGFGDEVNERTQSSEEMARTVLKFADALGLDRFALMGTSMGGVVASWTAVLGGERITRLVLEAPGAFRPDVNPASMSPEQIFNAFHAHPERKMVAQPDPEYMGRTWPLVMRLMGPPHDEELERRLGSVQAPALVMFGSRDGIFGTAPGQIYKRAIPSCTFSIVYDAAHDIAGDRPEAFSALVSDFLSRGTEFVISDKSTLIYR